MTLERDDRSLQALIKRILREEITKGVWRQGDRLPTEPELMRRFSVSRITVSQALRDLVTEGLVVRRQGKGTFVSSHPQGWTNLGTLLQRMPPPRNHELGHALNQLVLTAPPTEIALDLQLEPGDQTWVITRTKMVDGSPDTWEQGFIPASLVKQGALVEHQDEWKDRYYIEILRELTGQVVRRCRAFIQAVALDDTLAAAIGEEPGKPTIEVTRLWHNETGQPVLLTRNVLRPDGTRYFVDLPELPAESGEEG